ncbi:unnamed protein product, partial [Iphiclides podalirius]
MCARGAAVKTKAALARPMSDQCRRLVSFVRRAQGPQIFVSPTNCQPMRWGQRSPGQGIGTRAMARLGHAGGIPSADLIG